ncbi:MAG: hypothetical protein JXR63_04445 [Spirochaetales bacterium]|nr:hypothetical protein [Spirochaetales bacterium]
MAFCPRCGVEIEDDAKNCPLCNSQVPIYSNGGKIIGAKMGSTAFAPDNLDKTLSESSFISLKRLIWTTISIFLLAAALIVAAVDLVVNETITWSIFPLSALCSTWAFITFFFTMYRYPIILILSLFSSLSFFVWLIMFSVDSNDGFIKIAFPIIVVVFAVITIIVLLVFFSKKKGINIIGFVLLGVAIMCLGIDFVIKMGVYNKPGLTWSFIVAATLVPFSIFMFYLHHRLKNRLDFRKIFHF